MSIQTCLYSLIQQQHRAVTQGEQGELSDDTMIAESVSPEEYIKLKIG